MRRPRWILAVSMTQRYEDQSMRATVHSTEQRPCLWPDPHWTAWERCSTFAKVGGGKGSRRLSKGEFMNNPSVADTVRGFFLAFQKKDRQRAEELMAEDFTFSSPTTALARPSISRGVGPTATGFGISKSKNRSKRAMRHSSVTSPSARRTMDVSQHGILPCRGGARSKRWMSIRARPAPLTPVADPQGQRANRRAS
jgi:hypothetical protein